jgi:hypothetical protein
MLGLQQEDEMSDRNVDRWKQAGHLWVWRYLSDARKYRGIHLTGDPPGCDSLLQLIDHMLASKWPSSKQLVISKEAIPDPSRFVPKKKRLSTVKLKQLKDAAPADHWNLSLDSVGVNAVLEVGTNKMQDLKKGIEDVRRGEGDYAIGPSDDERWDELCLWLW